jgi:FkbM family methyltransferase
MKKLLKTLYELIPFKKGLFSLLKVVWTPPETIYKHLHFKGVISFKIDQTKFSMMHHGFQLENDLFWTGLLGAWEKESLALWIKLSKHSNVIFDIGANTGVYSLISKCVNPDANLYAFEPVKRVFEKLILNTQINNYDINCLEIAASNYSGDAVIYDSNTPHTYSVAVNKKLDSTEQNAIETKIKTITLDSFCASNAIKNVDLVKIDVETHEAEVIEGFIKVIRDCRPTILIEILESEIGKNVESMISDLGYLYFNINEKDGIKLVDHIEKSDVHNYLLCQPDVASKLGLLHLLKRNQIQ